MNAFRIDPPSPTYGVLPTDPLATPCRLIPNEKELLLKTQNEFNKISFDKIIYSCSSEEEFLDIVLKLAPIQNFGKNWYCTCLDCYQHEILRDVHKFKDLLHNVRLYCNMQIKDIAYPPLYFCLRHGYISGLFSLKKCGINFKNYSSEYSSSPLVPFLCLYAWDDLVARQENIDIVHRNVKILFFLSDEGVDVNAKDLWGKSGLEYILEAKNERGTDLMYWYMILILVLHGADLNMIGRDGHPLWKRIQLDKKTCPLKEHLIDFLELAILTAKKERKASKSLKKGEKLTKEAGLLEKHVSILQPLNQLMTGSQNKDECLKDELGQVTTFTVLDPTKQIVCNSEQEFVDRLYQFGDKIFDLFFLTNDQIQTCKAYSALYFCVLNNYRFGLLELHWLGNCSGRKLEFHRYPLMALACSHNWIAPIIPPKQTLELIRQAAHSPEDTITNLTIELGMLGLLYQFGVDVNAKDHEGKTALEHILLKPRSAETEALIWGFLYYLIQTCKANLYQLTSAHKPIMMLMHTVFHATIYSATHLPLPHNQFIELFGSVLEFYSALPVSDIKSMRDSVRSLHKHYKTDEKNVEKPLGITSEVPNDSSQNDDAERDPSLYLCLRNLNIENLKKLIDLRAETGLTNIVDVTPAPIPYMFFHFFFCSTSEISSAQQQSDFLAILTILIENGADVDAVDTHGKTPLEYLLRHEPSKEYFAFYIHCLYLLLHDSINTDADFTNGQIPFEIFKDRGWNLSVFIHSSSLLPSQIFEIFRKINPMSFFEQEASRILRRESLIKDNKGKKERKHRPFIDKSMTRTLFPQNLDALVASCKHHLPHRNITLEPQNECLNPEHEEIKKDLKTYFMKRYPGKLPLEVREIISFFKGTLTINDIKLSLNPRHYLTAIKIIELAVVEHNKEYPNIQFSLSKSSYALRAEILRLCSPDMSTCEAYTKTLDPKKMQDRSYLQNPSNWIPERADFHLKILREQLILAAQKKGEAVSSEPSIWAVRGGTAYGKSHSFDHDDFFKDVRNQLFFNPDVFKHELKLINKHNKLSALTNTQVHNEGIVLCEIYKEILLNAKDCTHFFMEGRYSTVEDVESGIVELARQKNGIVFLLDIHQTLLEVPLNRILARDPCGKDPCPDLRDIIKGYRDNISYRRSLIDMVKREPRIKYYRLYVDDEKGIRHIVAEKCDGIFHVVTGKERLFKHSCAPSTDTFIDAQIRQNIEQHYIDLAKKRGDIPTKCIGAVEFWKGMPLGKAVEYHAQGIPLDKAIKKLKKEATYQEQYGEIILEPFSGDWLIDHPSLLEHILIFEQQLHIRGVDENGSGLHFLTGTFSSKLNPKYNPENGFQMRIGYFIVPPEKMHAFKSEYLSPDVLTELEVWKNNVLLGYRLFVHPEAYDHYTPLLDAKIPFVKPVESEFIGTPTSSYRSWVIRRGKATPFIVKLGVASSATDVSRLLPRCDVERSIEMQKRLDKMNLGDDLMIFPETFGLSLDFIQDYPPKTAFLEQMPIDSGMIVREIPKPLLEQKVKIVSFSAVMSVERSKEERNLPLIYEIMDATIKKGLLKTPIEFVRKYLIEDYLKAIEGLAFKEGFAFSPHGQNLCWVLNLDNTPRGFAYRDLEGIPSDKQNGYIESYSWFWRYHIFIKLNNVISRVAQERMPPPPGSPSQLGCIIAPLERNLQPYIIQKINTAALAILNRLSLTVDEASDALKYLDKEYLSLLSKYFDVEKAAILTPEGYIPAAEKSSSGEGKLHQLNSQLWKYRITDLSQQRVF